LAGKTVTGPALMALHDTGPPTALTLIVQLLVSTSISQLSLTDSMPSLGGFGVGLRDGRGGGRGVAGVGVGVGVVGVGDGGCLVFVGEGFALSVGVGSALLAGPAAASLGSLLFRFFVPSRPPVVSRKIAPIARMTQQATAMAGSRCEELSPPPCLSLS